MTKCRGLSRAVPSLKTDPSPENHCFRSWAYSCPETESRQALLAGPESPRTKICYTCSPDGCSLGWAQIQKGREYSVRVSPPFLSVPPMSIDVRSYEFKTIEDLLASGHEVTLSVSIVVVSGVYPTDLYARVLTCLDKSVKVDSTQQLRAVQLVQFPVILHPLVSLPVPESLLPRRLRRCSGELRRCSRRPTSHTLPRRTKHVGRVSPFRPAASRSRYPSGL